MFVDCCCVGLLVEDGCLDDGKISQGRVDVYVVVVSLHRREQSSIGATLALLVRWFEEMPNTA